MKPAIALFARAPIPSGVKTRLIGPLSAEQVAHLYRAFVLDMWEMLASFAAEAELFLYTDREHVEWRSLAGGRLRLQQGLDLGQRMLRCFEEMRDAGFRPLLILGSDSPALPPEAISNWTGLLADAPALLGPTQDGGYYAIGCHVPHPKMFDGVEWSTSRTLDQTIEALKRCDLSPVFLPPHYDVDTPEDLVRLRAEPRLGRHTREWVLL